MMQARKRLSFNKSNSWLEKFVSEDFDVPMGCFDRTEVSELVGLFILAKLCNVLQRKNVGLY